MAVSHLQLLRGTAEKCDAYTGPIGEVIVDTDNMTLRIQDGATAGGHALVSTSGNQTIGGSKEFSNIARGVHPADDDNSNALATTQWVIDAIDSALYPGSIKTPLGRRIYRHANDKGSVIVYNELGVRKQLFVADAAYRKRVELIGSSKKAYPGLNEWNHRYAPVRQDGSNVIDVTSQLVYLDEVDDLSIHADRLNDKWFNAALTPSMTGVLQTARVASNVLLDMGSPAVTYCRSLTDDFGFSLDVPNIFQAYVLYAEGDIIDSFDPTVSANRMFALGKMNSGESRGNVGRSDYIMSSTLRYDYGDSFCVVSRFGYMSYAPATQMTGFVPVFEIG